MDEFPYLQLMRQPRAPFGHPEWMPPINLSDLFAGLLTIAVLLIGSPANAATTNYVALGDSYASGYGAGDYSGGSCYRSAHAYPVLWAQNHAGTTLTFTACSGAVTADVINGQVGSLSAATTLVTISIGGKFMNATAPRRRKG